ncbi:MAG: methyltransferase domain-containing protein [Pseudomonadota bacterium]
MRNALERRFSSSQQVPEELFDLVLSPIRWQLIDVSLELGVFDSLTDRQTDDEVAEMLSLQHDQCRLFLNALCSIDVLSKNKRGYKIRSEVAPYLTSNSDRSLCNLLRYLSSVRHADKAELKDMLRNGQSRHSAAGLRDHCHWDNSYKHLREFHDTMSNPVAIDVITSLPGWPEARFFLDLGAGSDSLANALISLKRDLRVSLFDLPGPAKAIERRLDASLPINVIAGDYNTANFENTYDIIWASMSLYFAQDIIELLKKLRAALTEKGVFVSFHEALRDDRTKPEAHVVGRLVPSLVNNDLSLDDEFMADRMRAAGFKKIVSKTIQTAYGEMRVDIGRKN